MTGYVIRSATPADVALLPDIERRAALLFKTHPEDLGIPETAYEQPTPVEVFAAAQEEGRLWVAVATDEQLVGFALVHELSGCVHLDELDVLPSHGRQGIGSALLTTVCEWARQRHYPAVTLRTFRDVPWNAPFYRRRGFRVCDGAGISNAHLALEPAERARGLRTDNRVTMRADI